MRAHMHRGGGCGGDKEAASQVEDGIGQACGWVSGWGGTEPGAEACLLEERGMKAARG